MVVVAAEPKELTIVQIEGPIRPEDIARLPHMNFWAGRHDDALHGSAISSSAVGCRS